MTNGVDNAKDDLAEQAPAPVSPLRLDYRQTKTLEQRVRRLERELRLFQVVGTIMALFTLLLMAFVLKNLRLF